MSQRRVQIVILCEDRQQEVFARHFLKERGFTGLFRANTCPAGHQSGEQYVRDRYVREAKAYRQNRNRVSIALVVILDADIGTLENRLNQLNSALREDNQPERQSNEAIAIFIPKRNIETWIHHLQGKLVNENDSYQKSLKARDCRPYVSDLAEQCRNQNLPNHAPPSLQAACSELQRLLSLIQV
jgi:hypothetical protein